jgi:hypothetical protein
MVTLARPRLNRMQASLWSWVQEGNAGREMHAAQRLLTPREPLNRRSQPSVRRSASSLPGPSWAMNCKEALSSRRPGRKRLRLRVMQRKKQTAVEAQEVRALTRNSLSQGTGLLRPRPLHPANRWGRKGEASPLGTSRGCAEDLQNWGAGRGSSNWGDLNSLGILFFTSSFTKLKLILVRWSSFTKLQDFP